MNLKLGAFILRIPRGAAKTVRQILAHDELLKMDPAWLADLLNLLVVSRLRLSAFNQMGLKVFDRILVKAGGADRVQKVDDLIRALRYRQRLIMRSEGTHDANALQWKAFLDRVAEGDSEALEILDQDFQAVANTWVRGERYLEELTARGAKPAHVAKVREAIAHLEGQAHEGMLQFLLDHANDVPEEMWRIFGTLDLGELDGLAVLVRHGAVPDDLLQFMRFWTAKRRTLLETLHQLSEANVEGLDQAINLGLRAPNSREGFIGQLAGAATMLRKYQHSDPPPRIRLEVDVVQRVGGRDRRRSIDVQVIVDGRVIDLEVKTLVSRLEWLVTSDTKDQMRRDLVRHLSTRFQNMHWGIMRGARQNVENIKAALRESLTHPEVRAAILAAGHTEAEVGNWLTAVMDDVVITLI